jgi:hypothetical protein
MKSYFTLLPVMLFMIISCAEETTAPFVPQITNFWKTENDDTHTFVLSDQNSGTSKGTFTGSEDYADSSFFGSELSGNYNNRDIEFNVQRPTGTFRYYGTIKSENRMELNSAAGKIVIIK